MEKRKDRIYLCLAHMSEAGIEQKYIKEAFDTNWVVPLAPTLMRSRKISKHLLVRTSAWLPFLQELQQCTSL